MRILLTISLVIAMLAPGAAGPRATDTVEIAIPIHEHESEVNEVFLKPIPINAETSFYIDEEDGTVVVMNPAKNSTMATTYIEESADSVTEEILFPTKIGEGIYEYRDADGNLVATFKEFDPFNGPRNAMAYYRYLSNWNISANSVSRDSHEIPSTGSTLEINYSVMFSPQEKSYAGFYHSEAKKYTWFAPPSSSALTGSFYLASSHPTSFSIKNDSSLNIIYCGYYSY